MKATEGKFKDEFFEERLHSASDAASHDGVVLYAAIEERNSWGRESI